MRLNIIANLVSKENRIKSNRDTDDMQKLIWHIVTEAQKRYKLNVFEILTYSELLNAPSNKYKGIYCLICKDKKTANNLALHFRLNYDADTELLRADKFIPINTPEDREVSIVKIETDNSEKLYSLL